MQAAPPHSAGAEATSDSRQIMFRSLYRWIAPLFLLALAACGPSLPAFSEISPQAEQTLRPGDIVELVVWREEDMSGEFMVDQQNHVVLPRVGKWDVQGETELSLEERLTAALGEDLNNPAIDVIVLRRIQVLGAVEKPGLYALDNTMTLGDALATAGGVGPTGRHDRIDLIRGSERYVIELDRGRQLTDLRLRSGDSLYVPQRSWLLRNSGAVITGVSSLAGLVALLISTTN